ncbi:plasmid mobilization relaxosome protein MobC [Mucilaginibacter sp. L196]|uniref:plasmid mobilization protein n=1 Tax=Mucilaginibacter sp. L196 TaxID=1641870 RepID=UPI00131BAF2F|nr:plasmid mobilization relaxosome protein MobC [Mucilaginibacter sp. L196]
MGRPKMERDKKLSRRFIFRLTEDELNRLNKAAEACGKAPGTIVRVKLFRGRFPEPKTAKLDLHTFLELRKIGVNLNQLTKKVNSGFLATGLLPILMKLKQQQEIIINQLIHDSQSENR